MELSTDAITAQAGFDARRLNRVADLISSDIAHGGYDGASLIVARHGTVVLDLCEGYADRRTGRRLERDSVFHVFSLTKQWVATVALRLIEAGYFRLTTPLSEIVPEFAAGKERINVYHILTQTSGLPDIVDLPEITAEMRSDMAAFVRWSFDQPPIAPPGKRLSYSRSLGHTILAYAMERVTGRPFATLMDEQLFAPAGMTSSSLGLRDDMAARLCPAVVAHERRDSGRPGDRMLEESVAGAASASLLPGAVVPANGGFSTIGDLHRYVEMMRAGGSIGGERILSPAMTAQLSVNRTGDDPFDLITPLLDTYSLVEVPGNIGLGFYVRGRGVTHGPFGFLNSARAFAGVGRGSTAFWIDPDLDLTFCLLTTGLVDEAVNLTRASRLSDVVIAAIDRI